MSHEISLPCPCSLPRVVPGVSCGYCVGYGTVTESRANAQPQTVDPSGTFTLATGAGNEYVVSPSSPPGVYVADVRLGGRSVLNTPIRADENDREPIEVVVRDDGAHIAGTLLSSGRGLGFSEVVLVPNAPRRTAFAHYKTVMTDYHGHFEFVDVPPGEYKLFAWASTRWRVDKRGIPVEV